MPSVYDLKPAFQNLLRPLVRGLAQSGVTANQVTVAAVVLSGIGGACIAVAPQASWPLLTLPAVLLARMALNAIDGMLAREHGMQSRLGAVLNEMGDVVADTMLYLPLALVPGFCPWLVVLMNILAVMSEMMGVVAVQIGASRRYDGPMGKSDRAFWLSVAALLRGLGVPPILWLFVLQAAMCVLLVKTITNRARGALAQRGHHP